MIRTTRFVALVVLSIAFSHPAQAAKGKREPIDPAGIARLIADSGGNAKVSVHEATGAARFVRTAPGQKLGLQKQAARAASDEAKKGRSAEFLEAYGSIFGITSVAAELKEVRVAKDRQGGTHITYQQVYRDLPVFAGELRSHFDASDELVAVTGTFVPELLVDSNPRRTAEEAGKTAVAKVEADLGQAGKLSVAGTTLLVFREGLAKGVAGPNRLAWQVEVGDGATVREFVYVDAHTGKFIDQITGIFDALNRRAYDGAGANPGPNYPANPFWVEGQLPFPTGNAEADNMILASGETYGLFSNAFGRDSFDGAGATMDAIFNRGGLGQCPNASWNGTFISFCPGITTDDVTGHEWGHAYTQYTHNLIYAWQPGALNESYSDIWGETVDLINGRGVDAPDNLRADANCSLFDGGSPPPTLTITGGSAAGSYFATRSVNEPPLPLTVGPTAMAIAATAAPFQPTGACGGVTGVSGQIAIVDWTLLPNGANECGSGVRANNARLAGATGIIFVAPPAGLLNLGASTLIASVQVRNADGATIKAGLPASATITIGVGTDNSYRWLMGEESTAPGLIGALRDMWNPTCFGNAGKVSDGQYTCSTADGGGVHSNSGVPNHAYALLVDGGSYNGQTIAALGLTKAAHIYFRAMDVYQGPASDFADHADALEQSCSDLTGTNLADLSTGAPSGQIITASDCAQVAKAALAVELRTPPTQCNFQPLLKQNPPALCTNQKNPPVIYHEDFEDGLAGWTLTNQGVFSGWPGLDWTQATTLPGGRLGSAAFGVDPPDAGNCDLGAGDISGMMSLSSPAIHIPASNTLSPRLTFEHYAATEAGWDGGNLKISINGGPYVTVPATAYTFNAYNATLNAASAGNTNPLAGQPGFTGTDGGSVLGSWGQSQINLTLVGVAPGHTIRLRYDFGMDGCGGNDGWYVDDVKVRACNVKK